MSKDMSHKILISPEIMNDWQKVIKEFIENTPPMTEEQIKNIPDEIVYIENDRLVIECSLPNERKIKRYYMRGWSYNN